MTGRAAAWPGDVVSFGPFELGMSERLLARDGAPVTLGGRALDILVALVACAPEIVGKRDLLARAWPDTMVDDGNLRFQVACLRKALGDGENGARYIATVAGRGYCFVAPVSRRPGREDGAAQPACDSGPRGNLPGALLRMVGRSADVLAVSAQVQEARFVTIVGSGGVGKTTLAVAVGHKLVENFEGAVVFVDLGALGDSALTGATLASLLGLSVQSDDPTPSLIVHLRDRRVLLILDTCEHLIDAVAALAECIFVAAPHVHILATSREALRAKGEHVFKLEPLAVPPVSPGLTAAFVRTFPAADLFLERAAAAGARLDLSDADAGVVAEICQTLGGMPLAIELAAGRVEAYGLRQTAALLDQRLALLWPGQRTAPPRQRTLQATLDWSYGLLSDLERTILRRLTAFVGHFTIEAAFEVVASPAIDRSVLFAAIDSLVAKSIVVVRPIGAMVHYRLLDTTRAYAIELPADADERFEVASRHAAYYRRWLEQSGSRQPSLSSAAERSLHLANLSNVRAALEWCFGPGGDPEFGVALATAAAPVFLSMSLLRECQRWSERAIAALDPEASGADLEMHLQVALGVSLMFVRGGREAARTALGRSFEIAEQRGSALDQLQILGPLNMFHLRVGEFDAALDCARRCSAIAGSMTDPTAITLAQAILGMSLHFAGDLAAARVALETALRQGSREQRTTTVYLGFEGRTLAGAVLGRTLWLQGFPTQAAKRAAQAVCDAESLEHPLTLCIALVWAVSVFLWTGDHTTAEQHLGRLCSYAEAHSLAPYLLVGRGFEGKLAIQRGDLETGVAGLRHALEALHAAPYELLTTSFKIDFAEGLITSGRLVEAAEVIENGIRQVEASGDDCYVPELLRLRGRVFEAAAPVDEPQAERCFLRSLKISREQGARAWELRAARDYAALLARQGRNNQGRGLLQPVFDGFAEGLETADLRGAVYLLDALSASDKPHFGNRAAG